MHMIATIFFSVTFVLFVIWVGIGLRLLRSLRRFSIKKQYTAAIEAPSVSVCIPARNETHAMTECLERVLASDYRKLEVLVYDDSSVDDTSVLIRSFAHAGVRFVEGDPLPDGWLGKNHALDVLSREASGTFVLFMDVDTIIKPTTISQLVGYTMTEDIVMSSVIPGRENPLRASVLFGHLRYLWQLILSRERMPATSSSLWMIKRRLLLETIGGFAPHRNVVEPESQIAALVGARSYRCLVDTPSLGVTYEKKWLSQVETSRRLLYPSLGGIWYAGLAGVTSLVLLNVPAISLLLTPATGWYSWHWLMVGLLILFGGLYGVYTHRLWRGYWALGMLTWPFVVFQELVLLLSSITGYVRGTITWKGRSIRAERRPVINQEVIVKRL